MRTSSTDQLDTLIQFLDPSASAAVKEIAEKILEVYDQYTACAAAQGGPVVVLNERDNEEVITNISALRRLLDDLGQQYRMAEILGELSRKAFGSHKKVRLNFRYPTGQLRVTHLRMS